MQLNTLIEIVIVMLAMMYIGYAGARRGIFTKDAVKALSWLIFNLFLVCASFSSICTDVPDISGKMLLHTVLILSLTMALPYLISYTFAKLIFRRDPSIGTADMSMSVINTMMFGLPIVQQVYGGTSVMFMGLSCVPGNLLIYTYAIWRLLKHSGGGAKIKIKLRDILTPVLIGTFLGLFFLIAKLPVPALFQRFLSINAAATLPVSMIVIGATMAGGSMLETFRDKRVYKVSFIKLIVCPLLAWLILSSLTTDHMLLCTAIVIAGCPTGTIVPVLCLNYDQDSVFASRCVMMTTLLAVITLPIIILVLG